MSIDLGNWKQLLIFAQFIIIPITLIVPPMMIDNLDNRVEMLKTITSDEGKIKLDEAKNNFWMIYVIPLVISEIAIIIVAYKSKKIDDEYKVRIKIEHDRVEKECADMIKENDKWLN